MYILNQKQPALIEKTTFGNLKMLESDLEEIIRKNIEMICDEDSGSMLVVGQQVKNEQRGRSDLTAIDKNGDLVLIEIKRDKADIENRKEAFEFQAIRYAASCSTIKSTDKLVQDLFAPYVEKHKEEFRQQELTSGEIAKRKLDEFIKINQITSFNEHQKIVLVASEFDKQTLSAVSWMIDNQVDISCYQICPYKLESNVLLDVKKLLPTENYYVNVAKSEGLEKGKKKDISRQQLPKIITMIEEWKIVKAGDIIGAKGTDKEAELLKNGQVKTTDGVMSLQQWLKGVYGWSSVQTYAFAVHKESGKTLGDIREEYMEQHMPDSEEEQIEE